ncbi:MAG: hypothetical protein GDA38_03970 [Hormoscilla sp. SP12CHS1]|nr:hypothetical protein [Hormoscilla sp. SP12CHS1]
MATVARSREQLGRSGIGHNRRCAVRPTAWTDRSEKIEFWGAVRFV